MATATPSDRPDQATPVGDPRPRRRPAARTSPEALAAARGGVQEGLAWLGREPEARASWLYRLLRLVARIVLLGVLRLRVDAEGREHVPTTGGYFLIAAAHRGWMDPFVAMHALPAEPRCWFLGSGPSTFTSRWRERLIHRLGGLLPVWRGGVGVDQHVAAAHAVIRNGGVFVQMPEGTINGPPGRIAPFRHGAALIALRTGAPIVLLAIAGTEELYIGRRMASRVLPTTDARTLLGDAWDGTLPEAGSREELDLARALTARFEAELGPVVEAIYPGTVDPPGRRRRLRHWLTWLLLSPGPVDRNPIS